MVVRAKLVTEAIALRRPSYLEAMKKVYKGLPSVRVQPLHFSPQEISGERLLAMMKVDESTREYTYIIFNGNNC